MGVRRDEGRRGIGRGGIKEIYKIKKLIKTIIITI
jgi:hypothetical protein